MKESVSGFKVIGTWGDVVTHGEKITKSLEDIGFSASYNSDFDEWNEWRPKIDERLSQEVNEKTASKASVNEGKAEEKGKKIKDNLEKANDEISETLEDIKTKNVDTKESASNLKEAINETSQAADTTSRTVVRTIEKAVYQNIMTVIAPYYFDNELISANITRNRNQEYVFEINVNDDSLKSKVSDRINKSKDKNKHNLTKHDYEPTAEAVRDAEGIPYSSE